jgi:hypothetical protein
VGELTTEKRFDLGQEFPVVVAVVAVAVVVAVGGRQTLNGRVHCRPVLPDFFSVQLTKTWKNIPNEPEMYQNDRKIYQLAVKQIKGR